MLALIAAALLTTAGYGAYWWHSGRFMQSTDDAYVGGDISAISTKVSGYIQRIAVQDNMAVRKGDLLVQLDARDYLRAALAKALAEVAAQQAALADGSLPAITTGGTEGATASLAAAQQQPKNPLTITGAMARWSCPVRYPLRCGKTRRRIIVRLGRKRVKLRLTRGWQSAS